MAYGIDKVINELKSRCGDKFDIDGIQNKIKDSKAPKEVPAEEEGEVTVVEIAPIEEENAEAETPELPESETPETEETEEKPEEEVSEDKTEENTEGNPSSPRSENEEELDTPSSEEKSKMDEILNAIKTFFPNENTEDVLVRIVSKLIDK